MDLRLDTPEQTFPLRHGVTWVCNGPARTWWFNADDASIHGNDDPDHDGVEDVEAALPGLVELVADSLRELCNGSDDTTFLLLARALDLHLSGVQSDRPGRWLAETLDAILTLVSPQLRLQVMAHLRQTSP